MAHNAVIVRAANLCGHRCICKFKLFFSTVNFHFELYLTKNKDFLCGYVAFH